MASLMTVKDYMEMPVSALVKEVELKVPLAIDALRNKFPQVEGSLQELINVAKKAVTEGVDNVKDDIAEEAKGPEVEGNDVERAPVIEMQTPIIVHAQAAPDAMAEIAQVSGEAKQQSTVQVNPLSSQQIVNNYQAAVDAGLAPRAPFAETPEQKQARAEFFENFQQNLAEGKIKLSPIQAFTENTTSIMMSHSDMVPVNKRGYGMAA